VVSRCGERKTKDSAERGAKLRENDTGCAPNATAMSMSNVGSAPGSDSVEQQREAGKS
jgi:hypothetical protein